jgi:hypothetical protein
VAWLIQYPIPFYDLYELLVALEDAVQRREFLQSVGFEGFALMLTHELPEPFAQRARLPGDGIELARYRAAADGAQDIRRDEFRLLQPLD